MGNSLRNSESIDESEPEARRVATVRQGEVAVPGTEVPAPEAATHVPSGLKAAMAVPEAERIARLARGQHGLITRAQLVDEVGLSHSAIDRRLKAGRLRLLHRGTYLVGVVEPPLAREMAAVLACGPGSYISHRTAACLWKIVPRNEGRAPVHVTVVGADRGRRPGLTPHRVTSIPESQVGEVAGIPVTSPARTLIDLAGGVKTGVLERAMARALRSGIVTAGDLSAAIAGRPGSRGVARLRMLLEREGGPALTRSEAERLFLAMIRDARLPAPEVNAMVAGYEVDFLWRSLGIAVEVDGFRFHGSRGSFEADRRRDVELAAVGVQVVRVTWRQLVEDERATLARLVRTLEHRTSRAFPATTLTSPRRAGRRDRAAASPVAGRHITFMGPGARQTGGANGQPSA